jgi:hypothetical protein
VAGTALRDLYSRVALKLRAFLPLLVAAVVAIAGCGGSDSDPGAVSLVKRAFAKPVGSANVTVSLGANLDGGRQLQGPLSLKLTGPYKTNGRSKLPSFDWNIALSGGGANFDGRLTSTGDDLYVGFQGQSYDVGAATIARYNQALTQGRTGTKTRSLSEFGIDPASWVKGAHNEGDATVAGTRTTHVSASIDFDKLLSDLNALVRKAGSSVSGGGQAVQLTAADRKQFTEAIKSSTFDVYVGKADGKVRRVSVTVQFAIPKSRQSQTNGVKSGSLNFSIQYSNLGQAQKIQAPPNPKPLTELVAQLGGSKLGNGSSTSPAPSSKQFQAYSKCLDKASPGDLGALQKCNALLK